MQCDFFYLKVAVLNQKTLVTAKFKSNEVLFAQRYWAWIFHSLWLFGKRESTKWKEQLKQSYNKFNYMEKLVR